MPRKAYLADLAAAQNDSGVPEISNVKVGADDGEFTFVYSPQSKYDQVELVARLSDVSEYPTEHQYMIFAADDAPSFIAESLETLRSAAGKSIFEYLSAVVKHLNISQATGERDAPFEIISDDDMDISDPQAAAVHDNDTSDHEVSNEDWDLDDLDGRYENSNQASASYFKNSPDAIRMRSDLQSTKLAGFRVGFIGNVRPGSRSYISISCRMSKLGISEEAMRAWDLESSQYLILLCCYSSGYQPFDNLASPRVARQFLGMRVGVSNFYKPRSIDEAQQAFKTQRENSKRRGQEQNDDRGLRADGFHECFISKPLNTLLEERFIAIVNYRLDTGMSWDGAEKFYNINQGINSQQSATYHHDYFKPENVPHSLPSLVTDDELLTEKRAAHISLPLLAMRFLLRHFVRCTEFCLVCHCKLSVDLDAIKPYVCDTPLCLYQFMSLGFGPDIEHEIMSQPCVVDLLISFCYSRATSGQMNDFPFGLQLNVPYINGHELPDQNRLFTYKSVAATSPVTEDKSNKNPQKFHRGKLRSGLREILIMEVSPASTHFRKGDWIQIDFLDSSHSPWHAKIEESNYFPLLQFSAPTFKKMDHADENLNGSIPEGEEVQFRVYDQNFDNLSVIERRATICNLLDLVPSIDDMRTWLISRKGSRLSDWVDRISPAALAILRWIVASNRSCIMQVDHPEVRMSNRSKSTEDRVQGVPGWMQFRFAMGAPDKEQRFVNQVQSVASRIGSKFPTRFAWHGSGLHNWHSIIREGLHFNSISNGRAFGNGIYFAPDFATSSGYVGSSFRCGIWPRSYLKINQAVSLNEIVNAPKEYVSSTPYFVVSQLDWVQTRYLFVKVTSDITLEDSAVIHSHNSLALDPDRPPSGLEGNITLPLTAVPRSRRIVVQYGTGSNGSIVRKAVAKIKDRKRSYDSMNEAGSRNQNTTIISLDDDDNDDNASVLTLPEDLEPLSEPTGQSFRPLASRPIASTIKSSYRPQVTPFDPRERISDLQLLKPPSYATSTATKCLQKDFRTLIALQESHIDACTLADLGWYLDTSLLESTNNLYQWIIQMHSFPLDLPLASDMSSRGITSIVFEILFHANYPISPPFLRVVRPRFLPFLHGGGGHVTAGGSICMDLLTSSGWSPVYDIASVLLQVRMALISTDPRPARLEYGGGVRGSAALPAGPSTDYHVREAVEAFKRAARAHGWTVPPDLDAMEAMTRPA